MKSKISSFFSSPSKVRTALKYSQTTNSDRRELDRSVSIWFQSWVKNARSRAGRLLCAGHPFFFFWRLPAYQVSKCNEPPLFVALPEDRPEYVGEQSSAFKSRRQASIDQQPRVEIPRPRPGKCAVDWCICSGSSAREGRDARICPFPASHHANTANVPVAGCRVPAVDVPAVAPVPVGSVEVTSRHAWIRIRV